MTHLKKFLQSAANPVLISIHPVFATAIVEGRKRVEFRRRWTQRQTDVAVIYSTAPVQKIVAIVEIKQVVRAKKSQLWDLSKEHGGSITREKLRDYMNGVDQGIALLLGEQSTPVELINPKDVFGSSFIAPQSFRYLRTSEIDALVAKNWR